MFFGITTICKCHVVVGWYIVTLTHRKDLVYFTLTVKIHKDTVWKGSEKNRDVPKKIIRKIQYDFCVIFGYIFYIIYNIIYCNKYTI